MFDPPKRRLGDYTIQPDPPRKRTLGDYSLTPDDEEEKKKPSFLSQVADLPGDLLDVGKQFVTHPIESAKSIGAGIYENAKDLESMARATRGDSRGIAKAVREEYEKDPENYERRLIQRGIGAASLTMPALGRTLGLSGAQGYIATKAGDMAFGAAMDDEKPLRGAAVGALLPGVVDKVGGGILKGVGKVGNAAADALVRRLSPLENLDLRGVLDTEVGRKLKRRTAKTVETLDIPNKDTALAEAFADAGSESVLKGRASAERVRQARMEQGYQDALVQPREGPYAPIAEKAYPEGYRYDPMEHGPVPELEVVPQPGDRMAKAITNADVKEARVVGERLDAAENVAEQKQYVKEVKEIDAAKAKAEADQIKANEADLVALEKEQNAKTVADKKSADKAAADAVKAQKAAEKQAEKVAKAQKALADLRAKEEARQNGTLKEYEAQKRLEKIANMEGELARIEAAKLGTRLDSKITMQEQAMGPHYQAIADWEGHPINTQGLMDEASTGRAIGKKIDGSLTAGEQKRLGSNLSEEQLQVLSDHNLSVEEWRDMSTKAKRAQNALAKREASLEALRAQEAELKVVQDGIPSPDEAADIAARNANDAGGGDTSFDFADEVLPPTPPVAPTVPRAETAVGMLNKANSNFQRSQRGKQAARALSVQRGIGDTPPVSPTAGVDTPVTPRIQPETQVPPQAGAIAPDAPSGPVAPPPVVPPTTPDAPRVPGERPGSPREFGVNWRNMGEGSNNPLAQSTAARIHAAVANSPELQQQVQAARGTTTWAAQNRKAQASKLIQDLNLDPKLVDWKKVGRIEGMELAAIRPILLENSDLEVLISKEIASGKLSLDEVKIAQERLGQIEQSNTETLLAIVAEGSQRGRDLQSMRSMATMSTDPAVWLVRAQRVLGEKIMSPEVRASIIELAKLASEACP